MRKLSQLKFESLEAGYNRQPVLRGVDGRIESGEWIHLFGKNGSGKTTLLQVLASLNKPMGGTVTWNGREIFNFKYEFRSNLRYFGHEVALYERLTVQDNWDLFTGLFDIHGTSPRDFTESISPNSIVRNLSRGQKRRVELASLIASPRELVILDEPLASLDQKAIDSLVDNLMGIKEDGGMVLTASPGSMDHADENWKVTSEKLIKLE